MRSLILIPLALVLAGCASLEGVLENRVSCTGDRTALYSSMYGWIGVTSKIAEVDSNAICGGRQ